MTTDMSEFERYLRDPLARRRAARRARCQETSCALAAAAWAVAAFWCLLGPVDAIGGLSRAQTGGVAVLCFVSMTLVAAQAGITRRLLALIDALEATRR